MMCPHGGTVQAISANTRTRVGGAYALRGSDTFLIACCPFSTPAGPHPCMQVQWVAMAARSRAMGDFTLTQESVGLCLALDMTPQGTVLIIAAEPAVEGI
jgi:hypothetical protein